jgi:hypothetical protein
LTPAHFIEVWKSGSLRGLLLRNLFAQNKQFIFNVNWKTQNEHFMCRFRRLSIGSSIGDHTWHNGYNGILFAEYLRTGDKEVLPLLPGGLAPAGVSIESFSR